MDSFMVSMMGSLRISRQMAADTYAALRRRVPDIMGSVSEPTHYAFRVPLRRDDGDYFLSISFPPDCGMAETALFRGDDLIYNEDWGYEDIRRGFGTGDPADASTIDALIAEIRRLGMNNPGHPDASDSEDEPEDEPTSPPVNPNQDAALQLLREEFQQASVNYVAYRTGVPVNENPENYTDQVPDNVQQ